MIFARIITLAWIWLSPNLPIAECSLSKLSNGKGDTKSAQHHQNSKNIRNEVADAMNFLLSFGVPPENLCTSHHEMEHLLPMCKNDPGGGNAAANSLFLNRNSILRSRRQRYLQETTEGSEEGNVWFLLTHALCALACVVTAALAAGLTMGLLSLDPLLLLIRMRAGSTEEEKEQAATLLPIVKQHHLLLVTLLLLNSIANEALPLFLEVLVSPLVAVALSVTLVLFGGEIIPSAIFTGPNKIKLAYQMTPLVRLVMFLLWPIAFPISRALDMVLHDDGEDTAFNRGELSALVRIQYEERLATKQQHKEELAKMRRSQRLDPTSSLSSQRSAAAAYFESTKFAGSSPIHAGPSSSSTDSYMKSLHNDEIVMVEGALQMKTKCAMDVYTPMRNLYAVPIATELNEEAIVDIYSSGFSRIPVFEVNPEKPKQKSAIRGVLMTKQLILVNASDCRPVDTLPLYQPMCVSPKLNLVDLLNMFQTGKNGHLALVCARPDIAESCLMSEEPLPDRAGFMGIVTLEDVLEELLQEEIADEYDKKEWKEEKLSVWVIHKWKRFVNRRKQERENGECLPTAVEDVTGGTNEPTENTGLLGDKKSRKGSKILGLF